MKPYVICHMMSSLDGHALTDGWERPFKQQAGELYERLAEGFDFDAWICGRVTMQEIAHDEGYPQGLATAPIPRKNHWAVRDAKPYAVSIDPHGKVGWKQNTALGAAIVEVLSEQVSDDYLAHLQQLGISYLFAGQRELDLAQVLETLHSELGVQRAVVEGGPRVSGAFVQAGLVDELSVLVLPLVDGRGEHPASFEIPAERWQAPAYLKLASAEVQQGGAVWLRYTPR
ncbi:dihydrofolate reductase family protein [Pseudomonas typographi]|uniref:Pyrimidine reductase n=1 Tax=Pseudomonas typographi TaxID=2715964 RepID=A0ABR7Z0B6_9PSED|nr:dihydrofolate reductase family protein [Pseudomonas typographi]MBD1551310.1 pyrimidine reductase [Pseudomonas typographi]MBD1588808.1 pyrimidine reductase [Pseudomonas typographi]MBD1598924.1 pyrimidine reductase [Pseudomonas typographi]